MKKKKLKALVVASLIVCSFGFIACGESSDKAIPEDGGKETVEENDNSLVYGSGDYTIILL